MPLSWLGNKIIVSIIFLVFVAQTQFEPVEIFGYEAQLGFFFFLFLFVLLALSPANYVDVLKQHTKESRYIIIFFILYLSVSLIQMLWNYYVVQDAILIENIIWSLRKFLKVAYLLLFYIVIYSIVRISKDKRLCVEALIMILVITSFLAVNTYIADQTQYLTFDKKYGNKNMAGFIFQCAFFLALYVGSITSSIKRNIYILFALSFFILQLATLSRGAVISSITGILLATLLFQVKYKLRIILVVALFISLTSTVFIMPMMLERYGALFVVDSSNVETGYGSTYTRLQFMYAAISQLELFSGHTLGLGNIYLTDNLEDWVYLRYVTGDMLATPHNTYVLIAMESGIAFAMLYLYLHIKSLNEVRKKRNTIQNYLIFAALISMFFRILMNEYLYSETFWFFIAIFYALTNEDQNADTGFRNMRLVS